MICPLTTGADNIRGTSGNDTFDGSLNASGNATFQSGDVIDGGAGTDTLVVALNPAAATTIVPSSVSNVEVLRVTNSSTANAVTLGLAEVSGLTQVGVNGGAGDVSFTGVTGVPAVRIESNTGAVTVNNNVASLAGAADNQTITLSSSGTGAAPIALTVTRSSATSANGLETVTLATTDAASGVNLTLGNSLGTTKLAVTGSQNLNITGLTDAGNTVGTIDASALTGSLVMGTGAAADYSSAAGTATGTFNTAAKVTILGGTGNDTIVGSTGNDSLSGGAGNDGFYLGAGGDDSVDGGAGDDTFYVGTTLTFKDTIAGGDGTDTLNLGAVATTGTTRSALNVTGIETVALNYAGATQDMSAFDSTVNRVNISKAEAYTLNNASASVATIGISSTASTLAGAGVTMSRATDTANDSVTVALGSGSYAYAMTGTALTLNNEESIAISAAGKATNSVYPAHTVTTLGANSATKLTVTGAADLAVSGVTAPALTTIDASAMTGAFTMAAAANNLNATISGGTGNDALYGGSGNDVITAGEGNNTVSAGDGKNSITAGAGNDTITSGDGNDTITAGAGNDMITLAGGSDSVDAGDGTDSIFMSAASLSSGDVIDGGAGTDTLNVTGSGSGVTEALASRLKNIEVLAKATGDSDLSITLTDAVMTANGTTSMTVRNYGYATAADAATGSSALTYGTGALKLDASGLTSGANTVSVTVTNNNAGVVAESVVGGAGNDSFTFTQRSGKGAALDSSDTVIGGQGADTVTLNASTVDNSVDVTVTLGANFSGIEKVVVGAGTGNVSITTDDGNLGLYESMTVDATAMTSSTKTLTFNGGNESQSSAAYNVLVGSGGSSVTGGAGNDSVTGGLGADTISGGAGRDSISGGAGNDSLLGGAGNDSLDGGTGDDTLDGGAGNDVLTGGTGNDVLVSGDGADNLTGGEGNDVYSYVVATDSLATGSAASAVTAQLSLDTITGFDAGGGTAATVVDKISANIAVTTISSATLATASVTSLGGDLAANSTLAAAAAGTATVVTVSAGTAAGTYLVITSGTGYSATRDTVIKLADAANLSNLITSNFSVGTGPTATADTAGFSLASGTGALTNLTGYTTAALAYAAGITAINGSSGTDTVDVSGEAAATAVSFNFATGALSGTTGSSTTKIAYLNMDTFTSGDENVTVTDGSRNETINLGTGTNTLNLSGGGTDTVSVAANGTLTATVSATSGTATITDKGTGTAAVTVSGAQTIVLDAEETGNNTVTLTMSRALTTSDQFLADSGDTSTLVLNAAQGSSAFTLDGAKLKAIDTITLGASGGVYNLVTEAGNAVAKIQAATNVVLGNVTIDASATTNALNIDLSNGATYTGNSTVTMRGSTGAPAAAVTTFDGGSGVDALTVTTYVGGTDATLNVTLNGGNDSLKVTTSTTAVGNDDFQIDGGTGTDTLEIVQGQNTTANAGDIKNFESVSVSGNKNFSWTTANADIEANLEVSFAAAVVGNITVDGSLLNDKALTVTIGGYTTASTYAISGDADAAVNDSVTVTLAGDHADLEADTIALAGGTADTLTINQNGKALVVDMSATVNISGVERLVINGAAKTDASTQVITLDKDAGGVSTVDASKSTGGITVSTGDMVTAVTIIGGAGSDIITRGANGGVATVTLNGGADTINSVSDTGTGVLTVTDFVSGTDIWDFDSSTNVTTAAVSTTGATLTSATAGAATNAYILTGSSFQINGALTETGNGGAVEMAIINAAAKGVANTEQAYFILDNGTDTGIYRAVFANIANAADVIDEAAELAVTLVGILSGVQADNLSSTSFS